MRSFFSQKGAMFGLDARIAMAIIAALSLVGGTTIIMTSAEVKGKALVKDIESYQKAIQGLEYDLKSNIHSALNAPPFPEETAIAALNDKTVLIPSAQAKWLGPYLKTRLHNYTELENYGLLKLYRSEKDDYSEDNCAPCFYWLMIEGVPIKTFEDLNTLHDPADEILPDMDGKVRYVPEAGSFPSELYIRLGKSL